MLPKTVHHVFLSATIPNAREFAEWICKVHEQPCHVVYTDYRPTPLQHYMFPSGGDGIYLVMDERSKLREDNFTKALVRSCKTCCCFNMKKKKKAMVQDAPAKGGKGGRKGGPSGGNRGPSDIYKIIKMIMERNYQPVIVFAFSKRECENLGQQMAKLDFNTEVLLYIYYEFVPKKKNKKKTTSFGTLSGGEGNGRGRVSKRNRFALGRRQIAPPNRSHPAAAQTGYWNSPRWPASHPQGGYRDHVPRGSFESKSNVFFFLSIRCGC